MIGNVISNKGKGIIDCNGRGIVKPNVLSSTVYGAEWAGTSSPTWTRTDASASFSDPNPYYAGMSGNPSSPFDNIMPWAGMRRVTDPVAGELVEIPKFYYKWTRTGSKMKLQISMYHFEGFYTSPAHADRGDGIGERDYVYVGRYHCASDYKSKSGVLPKNSITRATARTGIHNLRADIWQFDFAMLFTIQMLYLVEYATWDCQRAISYGCYSSSSPSVVNCGGTDSMSYHTGTSASSRSAYNSYMQYRYIEGLWANAEQFIDGVTGGTYGFGYNVSGQGGVYFINSPADFTDNSNVGEFIGVSAPRSTDNLINVTNNIQSYIDTNKGLIPSTLISNSSYSSYVCANCRVVGGPTYPKYSHTLIVGGGTSKWMGAGIFSWGSDVPDDWTNSSVGARLVVLPSTRIN